MTTDVKDIREKKEKSVEIFLVIGTLNIERQRTVL